jgi:hypothetical protein
MYEQRGAVLEDLKSSWQELDVAREQWIQDPLNPLHPDRIKELANESDRLSNEHARVNRDLYGSWTGFVE